MLAAYRAGALDTTGSGALFELTQASSTRSTRTPAWSLQPPGIAGRQPELWPHEDLEAARRLLAEASFPTGPGTPGLTFTYDGGAHWRALGEYLQRRWQESLGLTIVLEPRESTDFLKWRRSSDFLQRGDLYRGGWFSDYEDPHNWYGGLWASQQDGLAFNSGWKSDPFDALARQATGEPDVRQRVGLYGRAEPILAREYPAIPLMHYNLLGLVRPHVVGLKPERLLGVIPLRRVSVSATR